MHLSEMAGAILYPKTESLDIMGDYPLNGNVFRTWYWYRARECKIHQHIWL